MAVDLVAAQWAPTDVKLNLNLVTVRTMPRPIVARNSDRIELPLANLQFSANDP
jgi:hypothetical protein